MQTSIKSSFTKTDTLKTKAIAVFLMLFHHPFRIDSYINSFDINIPAFLEKEQLMRLATDARVCVWIFAFLSAYGITTKLCNQRNNELSATILYKQWWSLMKPYWFVYIVFFLASLAFPKGAYAFHEGKWPHILVDFLGCTEFFGMKPWLGGWWYMCFAQVLLMIVPLLLLLVEKIGIFSFPLLYCAIQFVSPGMRSEFGGYYSNYFYAVLLAIIFAKYDLFSRFGKRRSGILGVVEAIVLLVAFYMFADWKVAFAQSEFSSLTVVYPALSAVALCLFVQKYITVEWVEKALVYIGKHSGNIYLVHLAVYPYFPKIVFCTKTVLGSVVILVGISLLISIVLEELKKLLRYDKLINTISAKLLDCIAKTKPE